MSYYSFVLSVLDSVHMNAALALEEDETSLDMNHIRIIDHQDGFVNVSSNLHDEHSFFHNSHSDDLCCPYAQFCVSSNIFVRKIFAGKCHNNTSFHLFLNNGALKYIKMLI